MAEYPLNQSSWGRARQETVSVFHTIKFWVVEMISAPLVAAGMYFAIPSSASTLIKSIVPIAAFSIWMLAVLVGVFLLSLVVAPYKQRDQARTMLRAKAKPIPLQNREGLIRAIGAFQQVAVEVAAHQFNLNDYKKRNPNRVNTSMMAVLSQSIHRLNNCRQGLDREVLVAGKIFRQLVLELTSFVDTQMMVRQGGVVRIGGEKPILLNYNEFRARLGEIVDETVRHINEVSGQVPHKEDSQT